MNEQGFGPESAKIIADIFKGKKGCNKEFWSLDLGKNRLGNKGIEIIAKGIQASKCLSALDLGSNDIMHEGASILFKCLSLNNSLTYLNIANHDRLHRNRLSLQSCEDLCSLLSKNRVLSILNISDNRIGNAGLSVIASSLDADCTLCSLNLSNNNLSGDEPMRILTKYMRSNRNIDKFDLSSNDIGDKATVQFTEGIAENAIRLRQLNFE
jgi:Ran GTPase-activating protein (RanGAP) involved in mRNA processing and transport